MNCGSNIYFGVILTLLLIAKVATGNDDKEKSADTKQGELDVLVPFDESAVFVPHENTLPPPPSGGFDQILFNFVFLRWYLQTFVETTTTTTTTTASTTSTTASTTTGSTTTTVSPLPDWTTVENCRYKLYNARVTWNMAQGNCEYYGAHLAYVNMQDSTKRTEVFTKINYPDFVWVWLGFSDADNTGSTAPVTVNGMATTLTPSTFSYATTGTSKTCSIYRTDQTGPQFVFTSCSDPDDQTTPYYYLCEICP